MLLGIDLGANHIKFVEARKTEMGYSIARWAEVPMPVGGYADGQVIAPKVVGQALKEALKTQYRPGTRQVALSVGGQTALVRRLALPKLPLKRLRHLLETQGEQWIPFLREGACFDIAIVNPNMSDHEQEVLLVAIPQRHVEAAAQALRLAGLRLAALDVDINAHYRAALAARSAPREGTVAVLDLDQERARLGLFSGGNLSAVRSLEVIPYTPGPGEPPPDPMMLEGFAVDVRRSLELMLSQNRGDTQLAALVVVSARWPAKEMMGLLERELQGEMGHRLSADFQVRPAASADTPPGTTLAFGLSMVEASLPSGLALLPRATVTEQNQRRWSNIVSLALVAGAGLYTAWWLSAMPALQTEESRLSLQLAKANQYLEREPQVTEEEKRSQELQPLLEVLAVRDPWHIVYPHFKELLPRGVKLTQFASQPPAIRFTGSAPDPESVAGLYQSLEDSPYFVDPVLTDSGAQGPPVSFNGHVVMAPREESK